jgi:hypothetical protein
LISRVHRGRFAQRIVGWHAATTKAAELVLTPLRIALWDRDRDGQPPAPWQLTAHSDAGSQGGFNRSSQHLVIKEVFDGPTATTGGSGSSAGDALTPAEPAFSNRRPRPVNAA